MHTLIIGNGVAGITAARFIRKLSDHRITVISAETKHFYSRPALMYIYMGHMTYKNTKPYEDWFWEKNRINLRRDYVTQIDFQKKQVQLFSGEKIAYDQLILATGSASNKFGWEGQDLPGVQGLYSMQDLELMEENTQNIQRAVVIGGGLIGIEMVEMLLSRRIPVTFLVREQSFWDRVLPSGESDMINRHIREHHVDLRLATELDKILAGDNGRVRAIVTKAGEEIPCQFVGLTVGVHPNIGFIRDTELEVAKGILVNDYLETNIPDVYAIGDCAQLRTPQAGRRPIEAVWYTGKMMGATVAHTVCGKRSKYQPRIWFNSAKFFDIEYQTYGTVLAKRRNHEDSLYWEHPDGKKCLHLVYDKTTQQFIGINAFGIRLRHDVFEEWLTEERDLRYVIEHFKATNFDPELYETYEMDLLKLYNERFPNRKVEVPKKTKSLVDMIFRRGMR